MIGTTVGALRRDMGYREFVEAGMYFARKAQDQELADLKARQQAKAEQMQRGRR